MDFIYWIPKVIGFLLTGAICLISVELCVPALLTNLLVSQKIAMVIGFLYIDYRLGRFFGEITIGIRDRIKALVN